MKERTKYNNGVPMPVPDDDNELIEAIEEWTEGNVHLKEAIYQCIEHGVSTVASCAGHGSFNNNDPYLAFKYTNESSKTIYSILNAIFYNREYIRSIDFFNDLDERKGTPNVQISIHAKSKNKNKLFDLIAESAKGQMELEECHPIAQRIIDVVNGVKRFGTLSHAFSYYNFGFTKAIVFLNNTLKFNEFIYGGSKIRHPLNTCLTDSQVLRKLSHMCSALGVRPRKVSGRFGLVKRTRDFLIRKLEHDLAEPDYSIDLSQIEDESERARLFKRFGEGNKGLEQLLSSAFDKGIQSIYCCSGHNRGQGYVMFRVTDQNIGLLQDLGKILSHSGISTSFEDDYKYGKRVHFCEFGKSIDGSWFTTANEVLEALYQRKNNPGVENPNWGMYESKLNNPQIYYHGEMYKSRPPVGYTLKMKLLQFLKSRDKKALPPGSDASKPTTRSTEASKPWTLNQDQLETANKTIVMDSSETAGKGIENGDNNSEHDF